MRKQFAFNIFKKHVLIHNANYNTLWQMVGIQLIYTEWNCMFLFKMG